MMLKGQTETEQYDAFISYNRKDAAFARKLEKALEAYKPPRDLNAPQRYLQIFRDEGDMTGVEYFQSIERQIQDSAKLIVICSPAARQSQYVNDEIRRFAQAKGAENIIPLIVSGIPNNEAKPEQTADLAFPEALCEVLKMPLAISYLGFDPGKDNVDKGDCSNSWYTLLANLYNLSRSEIEQRDLKRRLRRRNIAIAIVSSVMICLAGLAAYAWWQKTVADERGKIALSRQLAAQANNLLDSELDLALLLSVEAVEAYEADPTVQATNALLMALQKNPQLRRYLQAHEGPVLSVAFSPDGKTLASGSQDKTVRLWDVASGQPRGAPLTGHKDSVYSVAFSPDGKTLASGSEDKTVRLWDVASGQPRGAPLTGHQGSVHSVAFSPDGKTLASGGEEKTVRLWDVASGQPRGAPLTGHQGWVESVAFSPDGKTLASGGGWPKPGEIILWDVASGQSRGEPLTGHKDWVYSVAFSHDGKTLVSGGYDKTVRLWDVDSGQPRGAPLTGHQGSVHSVAFSHDGKTLASGGGETIILWDVATGRPRGAPLTGHKDWVYSVAFSHDGKTLVSGGVDKTVRLWDVATVQPRGAPLTGHQLDVYSVAFSPDGKTLASGGGWYKKGEIILWDVASGQPRGAPLTGRRGSVVAFSSDGKTLASSEGETVRLWDADSARPRGAPLIGHQGKVLSVAFSPDGKTLASSEGKTIRLWDVASGQPRGAPLTGHPGPVVAFSPDLKVLASGGGVMDKSGEVILWDVASARPRGAPLTGHQSSVYSVAFSLDGKTLASGSSDKTIRLWDVDVQSWIKRACAIANRNLTQEEWRRYMGNEPTYRKTCPNLPVPEEAKNAP